jgi:ELWxxDGT repeat protein
MQQVYFFVLALLGCTGAVAQTLVANIEQANAGSDPVSLQTDGEHLIFFAETAAEGDELYIVDEVGELARFGVAIPGRQTFLNPNAQLIDGSVYFALFEGLSEEIRYYRANLETEELTVIATLSGGPNITDPLFTRVDTNRIVFVSRDDNYTFKWYQYDTEGGAVTLLTELPDNRFPFRVRHLEDGRFYLIYPYDSDGRTPLVVSDGTAESTRELYPDPGFAYLEPLAGLSADSLLFIGSTLDNRFSEYYVTDFTLQEFTPLREVRTNLPDGTLSGLLRRGDSLYFTVRNEEGTRLWRTDARLKDPTEVALLATGEDRASIQEATFVNDLIFYRIFRSNGSAVLARTDGTTAGTFPLQAFAGRNTVNAGDLGRPVVMPSSGLLYFLGLDDVTERIELYRTDGSIAGTQRVSQLGEALNEPWDRYLVGYGNGVYFIGQDVDKGREVYRSDGTRAGTQVLADLETSEESSHPIPLAVYMDRLLFTASSACTGREMYQTEGTAATTRLITDLNPGADGAGIYALTEINGELYFSADLENSNRRPIHRLNEEGGELTITPVDTSARTENILARGTISPLGKLGQDVLLLQGFVPDIGQAVYTYRPETGALKQLRIDEDVAGFNSSGTRFVPISDSVALFLITTAENGEELWRTDGTDAGTYRLTETFSAPNWGSVIQSLTAIEGTAYFTVDPGFSWSDQTVWRTDGTLEGTYALSYQDAYTRAFSYFPYGGQVHFVGGGYRNYTIYTLGEQLFDIREASFVQSLPGFEAIQSVTVMGERLLFVGATAAEGYELWGTDKIDEAVRLLTDIRPGPEGTYPQAVYAFDDSTFYFSAETNATGRELWVSDATIAGTYLVTDINPGAASSAPDYFLRYGDFIFFSAEAGPEGKELWKYSPYDLDNDGYTGTDDADETDPTINAGTAGNPNDIAAACVAPDSTTAIHPDAATRVAMEVFPNPAAAWVTVRSSRSTPFRILVFSADGRLLQATAAATDVRDIWVGDLTSGTYFLQLTDDGGSVLGTRKLVVDR